MITPALLPDLDRLAAAGCLRAPMLMLGAQESTIPGFPLVRDWFHVKLGTTYTGAYTDLDLADGNLKLDLNHDLREIAGCFATVFNLGTVEHVWDVHTAFCNALRAVAQGGTFITHSPVGGWVDQRGLFNHGIHMTRAEAIAEFVEANGFEVRDQWTSRFGNRGMIYWMHARKVRHIEMLADFAPIYRIRGLSRTGYRTKP